MSTAQILFGIGLLLGPAFQPIVTLAVAIIPYDAGLGRVGRAGP